MCLQTSKYNEGKRKIVNELPDKNRNLDLIDISNEKSNIEIMYQNCTERTNRNNEYTAFALENGDFVKEGRESRQNRVNSVNYYNGQTYTNKQPVPLNIISIYSNMDKKNTKERVKKTNIYSQLKNLRHDKNHSNKLNRDNSNVQLEDLSIEDLSSNRDLKAFKSSKIKSISIVKHYSQRKLNIPKQKEIKITIAKRILMENCNNRQSQVSEVSHNKFKDQIPQLCSPQKDIVVKKDFENAPYCSKSSPIF